MGEITARCADHRTPLLYEQWYVAALSTEVSQALSEVWVLQHSLVVYRKRDGVAVALQNRCPHRSYPLSHGVRDGDSVICGYHGLTFDADGRCVRIPSQESVATRLRTRSYPIVEQRPFIWIWMGAGPPTCAPPAAPWLNNPDYADVCGVFDVPCSYIRLHENVLDLTHLPFLHRASFKTPELSKTVPQMSTDGIQVRVRLETQMQATSGAVLRVARRALCHDHGCGLGYAAGRPRDPQDWICACLHTRRPNFDSLFLVRFKGQRAR